MTNASYIIKRAECQAHDVNKVTYTGHLVGHRFLLLYAHDQFGQFDLLLVAVITYMSFSTTTM